MVLNKGCWVNTQKNDVALLPHTMQDKITLKWIIELNGKVKKCIYICIYIYIPKRNENIYIYIPKRNENIHPHNLYTNVYNRTISKIIKNWKQTQCSSTDEWLNIWYIYAFTVLGANPMYIL